MFYNALSKEKVSIKGMLDGYKFCKKTRIVFIVTYVLQEIALWGIMSNLIAINNNTRQLLIFIHEIIFYIISYRVSFMRYYSMEGFCGKEKKINLIDTVKGSFYTSKHTVSTYIAFKIIFMIFVVLNYYLLTQISIRITAEIYSFIYLILARIFDELIRISIYQLKKREFINCNVAMDSRFLIFLL